MRCNVLFLKEHVIDSQIIIQQLLFDNFRAHISTLNSIDDLDQMLEDKIFDIFVLSSDNETLIKYAQKLINLPLTYKLSTLFIQTNPDSEKRAILRDLSVKNILSTCPSDLNLASFISLALQKDRTKNELLSMGSFMRDATVHLSPDEDDDFIISKVNEAFLMLEDLQEDALLYKKVQAVETVFGLKVLLEEVQKVYQTGTPLHLPNYFYIKEGERHWFSIYIYKPHSHEVAIIASNLSELKGALDKVTRSHTYLQTILNAQRHIIYITNGEKLINTNKSFLKFFRVNTMYDFINTYQNVCFLFEKSEEPFYIDGHDPLWLKTVLSYPNEIYKIRIKQDDVITVFVPSVEKIVVNDQDQYVVTLTDITELEDERKKLHIIAMTDALTGAYNRFKFNSIIEEQLSASLRYQIPFSVIMLDIDHFKKVNDDYSHQLGDEVLKRLSDTIRLHIRKSDLFIRWGGDEFLILLPSTSIENTKITAEKLIKAIDELIFGDLKSIKCSFGITSFREDDTVSSLISRADEALYQAKHGGRDSCKVLE